MKATVERDSFDADGNPVHAAAGDPFTVIVWPFRPTNTSSSDIDTGIYDEISGRYLISVEDWSVDIARGDVLRVDNGMVLTITGIDFGWENPFSGKRPGRTFEGEIKR